MEQNPDFDIQEYINSNQISKKIYNSCFTLESKKKYYSHKLNRFEKVDNEKQLKDLIAYDFPEIVTYNKKKMVIDLPDKFFSIVFFTNVIDMIVDSVNLFQSEKMKLKRVSRILYITRNSYNFNFPEHLKKIVVDEKEKKIIVDDYKNHFNELDDILEWIVACRFTEDRRSSFLHLRVYAGFGKSFFKSILSDLGFVVECRYDDFKSPSSLAAVEFQNALILLIDEFTIFKKDFKDFTNKMILDSKNQLRTQVALYAKIFLSAEHSNSFVDGVDAQIIDRVNQINKDDSAKLENRGIYLKFGNKTYYTAVTEYIYVKVKGLLNYYIELGEIQADRKATEILKYFHTQHILKAENLDSKIKKVFWSTIENILDTRDAEQFNNLERDMKKHIVIATENSQEVYYIKSIKKVFDLVIKNEDEEFYKKAKYKASQLANILNLDEQNIKQYKVNGKNIGISLKLSRKKLNFLLEKKIEVPTFYETIKG